MTDRSSGADLTTTALPQIIRPRLFLGGELLVGPGKIDLLRAVQENGSISAAARATGMGYKRAWTLLDEIRQACGGEVIEGNAGGSRGGGATVTPFGHALIKHYEAIEQACAAASEPHLKQLRRLLARLNQ
jgi:molybdate transport system regulatory protein